MGVFEVLYEIADSLDTEGLLCPSVVDLVAEEAEKRGLYGVRMCAQPPEGERLKRLHEGQVQHTNWHESWLYRGIEENFVIDPAFPKKVYPLERYIEECFLDPEKVSFSEVDEP
jgi:hypothetical protein